MKKVEITGKLVRIETDPAQYKPYSPTIEFEGVHVKFEVPETEVADVHAEYTVLTMNGVAQYILRPFAEAIDDMNINLQRSQAAKDATPQRRK